MTQPTPDFRVGIGFDSHPLAPGRRLVLGGVDIPHDRGLAGHSDGDVLVHALLDALLGAADLGDKGTHFPSSGPAVQGHFQPAAAGAGGGAAGRGWLARVRMLMLQCWRKPPGLGRSFRR